MSAAPAGCFHCGEPVPAQDAPRARVAGAMRAFCCGGCEAAAAWIEGAGLGGYYRARAQPALLPSPATDEVLARWDAPAFLAAHAKAEGGRRATTLVVEGIRCAACAWLIERALAREPGIARVSVNAATSRLSLAWDPAVTRLSQAVALLARLGYRAHCPARDDARAVDAERRISLKRLAVAGLGAMQAMMLSEALYFGAGELDVATRDFFRWITFLVATPVVFYAGWPFLAGAVRQVRLRAPGMDLLVAVSVLLAWAASLVETLRGGEAVYFDAAVMFIFFLLAARHIETEARRRATAALDVLARAQPELAVRLDSAGREATVAVAEVAPGDRLRVRVGDAVPVDGVLLDAPAELDESFVTGESRAVAHAAGEVLLAGSVALGSPLELRAARAASESTIARLAELAARAQAMRPRAARIADRVAGVFVVAMLVVAGLVGLAWWSIEPARALPATLAVLAATCPCALALAVPAAIAAAQAAFARMGALVLDPDAVESLARADRVIFDKTGTLTTGRPELAAVEARGVSRAEALAEAAALERGMRHPLAAVFAPFDDGRPVTGLRARAGEGIAGRIGGSQRRIGTRAFAAGETGDDEGIWLGDGRRALARFDCADAPRPGAAEALDALAAGGLSLEILSGDSATRVGALAGQLGVREWRSRCLPAAKLARVESLRARGERIAMVGDGVNDAAVLAGADVAIALADGAALAQASAAVVLAGPGFVRLPALFETARRARRVMRQNIGWAIAYNALALPLAAAGLVPPWLASLGMAASSLVVTLNALRLARPARARWRGAREQTRKFRRSLRARSPAGSRARRVREGAA
jgi:Cu2+-exporting ATPase